MNRNSIGIDINPDAIKLTKNNIKFQQQCLYEPKIYVGDLRNLNYIENSSVHLVITHPPYLNIIKYSEGKIFEDLSNITDVETYLNEMEKGIKEYYRILKDNSYCALVIGDIRKNKHYIPLSYYIMERFLDNGFALKEDIIKIQHNCRSTDYWRFNAIKYNIYLIMHEHIFIFRKPERHENLNNIKYSTPCLLGRGNRTILYKYNIVINPFDPSFYGR